jgi:molybdate transport system substrate-binding protein
MRGRPVVRSSGRHGPRATIPLLAALVALLWVAACGGTSTDAPPGTDGRPASSLTVYGAASLTDVLAAIERSYEAAVPGSSLTIATDSSAALATQIRQGAPADVFLSADTKNPDALAADGFAAVGPVIFAGNALAIIVPADDPAGITAPADLARPGVRIIAAGDQVPITMYANQLVANLAAQPGYPAGFEAAYAANVVSRENDVKSVAAKIELGEGDAAIVYRTDAAATSSVRTIAIPADANVRATYAGIVVGTSTHQAAARAFLDWLVGPDGQTVLASFGFESITG